MHNKKLTRAGVDSQMCERLKHHHVETCEDLLSLTPLEVMRLAGQSHCHSLQLLKTVSVACAPKIITAQQLWLQREDLCFSTSLQELDRLLHGGLPRATITEVAGPSGCGKSQLCMMLSVLATLPRSMGGLDSSVIYIDTESAFSAERLDHLEEDIISCHAGLVILDSVASVVRKEFDTSLSGNLTHRSNLLGREAATLKYLAQEFRIPVVVTNQITTQLSERAPSSLSRRRSSSEAPGGEGHVGSGYVTAALGNTWSHNVNTRLIVQYVDSHLRQIVIAKSPVAPFAVLNYTVQKEGLRLEGNASEEMISAQGTDPGLQPIRVRTGFDYRLTGAMAMTPLTPSTTSTGGGRCDNTGV
ncbi:DNA repair protein RAD51 homolog 2 isoform X4 [Alosa alosa]|uniref:DNA repair protein RAD51 homolog 2 isoform X4 n=1 Tax=Alosa alosa TaxID=278164 RepID=UPI00201517BD|nr:DNA repair protein RAD51 homolog 2 isoform X4 [Alosa alosa]